jgi:threonine/homoserine/homoserine lactone efflux protein
MLLGILSGFLAASLGWQINLIAIQRGLQRGRFAALLVGCGAILADILFLWTGLAGTAPILEHPEWWGIIRWVGISVILILAARVFFVHSKAPPSQVVEVQKRNPTRNFVVGFLVVISNPVVFLMWVGVIGFLRVHFPEARAPWFKEFFLSGFLLGGLLWFLPLALIFMKKLRRWTEANHTTISHISGGVLVAVALFLIFFEKF